MTSPATNTPDPPDTLRPLPYHQEIRDFLRKEEPELWHWFSSQKVRQEHAEAVRLDLLKSTYRVEAAAQPQLYELGEQVLTNLGLKAPLTFYQAQSGGGLNAALAFVPGEAHVILVGPIQEKLSQAELKALLGHELAHFLLLNSWAGEYLVVVEVLRALSNDSSGRRCHAESSRLFDLHTEIFADRGALAVTGDPLTAIATLIKTETGLTDINAESYLRQAEEIFSKSQVTAEQPTHPEPYIRARALKLYAEQGESANPEIERIIQGAPAIDQLDLLKQSQVAEHTRRLLEHFLAPAWFRTEAVLAHFRLYFSDTMGDGAAHLDTALESEIKNAHSTLQDYYCYVLLDFVAVDRDLEEVPLAAALLLSERLGLEKRFKQFAQRELGLTKKRLANIERDAAKILERTNAATSAS